MARAVASAAALLLLLCLAVTANAHGRELLGDSKKTPKQCLDAYAARGGRAGVEKALGNTCQATGSSFNLNACCSAVAGLLNSNDLSGCVCIDSVYAEICKAVQSNLPKGVTCQTARSLLSGCGVKCS